MTDKKENILKPADKFGLTIDEAASYFEIGRRKLKDIIDTHPGDTFYTLNGTKTIILRPEFEKFLVKTEEI